ncbi:MAG TPA: PfkB family carbohydrate kinase, partial [Thermoleophilaceae bacterium]|nr:PfkB family carbohydrate kinase [Thermoleophilaceae bacterium]
AAKLLDLDGAHIEAQLMLSRLMSLVVVGSIAFDAVKTPFGERERMLGGSAVHFSLAASFFTDVRVVGPVGDDFGESEYAVLRRHRVNTDDIEHVPGGRTFFWAGEYEWNLNVRHTLDTQLNVFGDFRPKLSDASRQADTLFLANIQPDLQRDVREQCREAKLAALDSMNLWIETTRDSLIRTIGTVDMVLMNDDEVRMLTEQPTLLRGARQIMELGPRIVVVKQGEYGASLFTEEGFFSLPAYPLETVLDPTGAGDAFAGGLLGYLDAVGGADVDATLRRATTYGSAVASFWVEEFGCERAERLTREEIDERYDAFRLMTSVEGVTTG